MQTIGTGVKELFTTANNRWSMTKTWSCIACATATWLIVHAELNKCVTWDLFAVYLFTVGGFSQLSKWMAYKFDDKAAAAKTDAAKGE